MCRQRTHDVSHAVDSNPQKRVEQTSAVKEKNRVPPAHSVFCDAGLIMHKDDHDEELAAR